jgi:hypothetical protein
MEERVWQIRASQAMVDRREGKRKTEGARGVEREREERERRETMPAVFRISFFPFNSISATRQWVGEAHI